jgi:hypothetical protein
MTWKSKMIAIAMGLAVLAALALASGADDSILDLVPIDVWI